MSSAAVDIVGNVCHFTEINSALRYIRAVGCAWSYHMAYRRSDLAVQISKRRGPDDGFSRDTFRLPVEAARLKAREILNEFPQGGFTTIVERWRQLPDGQIEFTMRRLRTVDLS
jgi:hypothetical protein